ncbi:MAG: spore coat protein [Angelakisella sp.]
MAEINGTFGDREMMDDLLSSQKGITGLYNTAANECASNGLKNEFMTILGEEHRIQMELFTEMNKRGWYPVEQAEQQKIQQTKDQFQNGNS